jgi:hypothetical protein
MLSRQHRRAKLQKQLFFEKGPSPVKETRNWWLSLAISTVLMPDLPVSFSSLFLTICPQSGELVQYWSRLRSNTVIPNLCQRSGSFHKRWDLHRHTSPSRLCLSVSEAGSLFHSVERRRVTGHDIQKGTHRYNWVHLATSKLVLCSFLCRHWCSHYSRSTYKLP